MSLIADALKAAQRERSGGASDVRRATAESVLRSSPGRNEAFAGMPVGLAPAVRWAAVALGGALIVAAAFIYLSSDEDELSPQAETVRQLPDPASTGRVDPDELPFLANLNPAAVSVGGATDGNELAGSSFDDLTAPVGVPSFRGAGRAEGSPVSSPSVAAGEGTPPGSGSTAPPSAVDGSTVAAAPSPRPTTVVQGRFELSVASSSGAIGERMAEAVAAQQSGDTGGAIVLYEQILAQRPDHVEARNNLGIALQSRGDLEGARDAYRSALAIDPGNASAWSNLGAVLSRLGETEQAEAALGEASRLDPTNLAAKVNLANLLLARGLASDASLLLAEVLQRDPRHAEASYAMARTLDAQGDAAGAVRYYQSFLTYGAGRFPALDGPVRLRIQQLTPR